MAEFDLLGEPYERSAVELPFREHLELHSMRAAAGNVAGLRILDLGCGSGLYARRYAQWGATAVVGVDISEGMLATARAQQRTDELPVEYMHCDATDPDEPAQLRLRAQFDLVSSVYVLCYADSPAALAGFFTTARRALRPERGRMVAMTLNPDYDRGTDYYARYGFTLTQDVDTEGAPVTLNAVLAGDVRISVTAHWWSRQNYENAARAAGFDRLRWILPTVSEQGIAEHGSQYWAAYLAAPQGVILHAE